MYNLECKDLGHANCSYKASADTADQVKTKMKDHLASAHPGDMPDDEADDLIDKRVK